jgi:hypothetical membrane protein
MLLQRKRVGPAARFTNPIAGLIGLLLYVSLAVQSYRFYPGPFGPGGNWLSDLGNTILNPRGAIFYRLGGMLGGSALFPFFMTLGGNSVPQGSRRILIILARIFGMAAALCFILTGVFSEDMMPMHSWFSMANFMRPNGLNGRWSPFLSCMLRSCPARSCGEAPA